MSCIASSRVARLISAVALAAVPMICAAWGGPGHQVVGGIADRILQGTPTERFLKQILRPKETLASVSVWADCAKGFDYCQAPPTKEMRDFVADNPDHHGYHYTDIWYEADGYDASAVGAEKTDIVHTISEAIAALQGAPKGPKNPHGFTSRQALLLLTHLVGDIHQPLHVGAAYMTESGQPVAPTADGIESGKIHKTEGGNTLHMSESKVLHSYWDTDAVKFVMTKTHTANANALSQALYMSDPRPVVIRNKDLSKVAVTWANETLEQSQLAFQGIAFQRMRNDYKARDGKLVEGWPITIPTRYPHVAEKIAEQQLLLAGKRLAALLQAVAQSVH